MLDPAPPEAPDPPAHGSTGPRTPDGKTRSSQNSLKHGCRSHILVLDDEKQEDLDALYQRWLDAYQPDHPAALELLEQFILNKWLLERNERRFHETEQQLSFFPFTKWTEGQHHIYQLALRYKTAAERAASKAQRDLEDYLKNRRAEERYSQHLKDEAHASYRDLQQDCEKQERSIERSLEDAAAGGLDVSSHRAALAAAKGKNRAALDKLRDGLASLTANKTRAQLIFQGQQSPKKLRKLNILEQWVEITVKDGVAATELIPSNRQLIERGQAMDPPPELVYRRLYFPHGVPREYHWTTPDPLMRQCGGLGVQRMSVDTWLDLIDREQLRSDGHIGPCGDPLPRPRERGGCVCPACEANRLRLEGHSLASPAIEPAPAEEPPLPTAAPTSEQSPSENPGA